ncbi:MAG: transglutaminase domain-containing protein [bacterium]
MRWRAAFFLFAACLTAGLDGAVARPEQAQGPDYSSIDKYVLNAPPHATNSLDTLAAYLCKAGFSDKQKARAIFRWISANISYDVSMLKNKKGRNKTAEELFESRWGICGCYVNLYQRLAELGGLRSTPVYGYSRGYGYTPGTDVRDNTHAWIAAWFEGGWHLIDPTWGSGYIDKSDTFRRQLNDYYFGTPPGELVLTHFPMDPKFQFRTSPMSLREFTEQVYLYPDFIRLGLHIGNRTKASIETGSDVLVTLRANNTTYLVADVQRAETTLPHSLALVQNAMGTFEIRAQFPTPGDYILNIYAQQKDSSNDADKKDFLPVMQYAVKASAGKGDRAGFPEFTAAFVGGSGRLYAPMDGSLQAGSVQSFKIQIPNAVKVAVIMGEEFHNLTRGGGQIFEGKVKVNAGDVIVGAMVQGESRKYSVLLRYRAY